MSDSSCSTQDFCFFLDHDIQTDLTTDTLPQGLRYLTIQAQQHLSIEDGKLQPPQEGAPSFQVDSIRHKNQSLLLLNYQPGIRVTINGLVPPLLSVLKAGDVLRVGGHALHVSLLNRPYSGRPSANHLTTKCGYCRVLVQDSENMRVYVCPNCRLPTHDQGEEVPAEERLQCVNLASHCGHCQAEIVRTEGFTYVPTL